MPRTQSCVAVVSLFSLLCPAAWAQTTSFFSSHPEQGGNFGASVASVAIGPNGAEETVIGAYTEWVGAIEEAGRVTIHRADGTVSRTLTSPYAQSIGRFGYSVSGVPDVNGDGVADIVVGAPYEAHEGILFVWGHVYIFNGSTGVLLRTLRAPTTELNGMFGASVAGIGDINGDGRGDIVVGAPRADPGNQPDNSGRVYVFSGKTGQVLRAITSPNIREQGEFGHVVAVVPDVNGDGKPDIAISAWQEMVDGKPYAGRTYLFDGVTGVRLASFVPPSPLTEGQFGTSIAGVPDTDGDGFGDIIIGSPNETVSGVLTAGRAHLYSGATGAKLRSFSLGAPTADDHFGFAVAAVPDMNGDGRGDIAIGAPFAQRAGLPADSGRVLLFSGSTGAFVRDMVSRNAVEGGLFGSVLAGRADDVSGNGKGDVIVGAPMEDTANVATPGRAYLFRN